MKRLLRRTLAVGLTALLLVQLIPSDVLAHDFPAGGGNSPYPPDDPDRGQPPPQCQPQQDPNAEKKGDPVDFQKGDYILARQDVLIPGRMPIDVTFTYRSRSTYNGPFGYGWDMSYNRRIRKLADNNVVALTGDGERELWTYNAGNYTGDAGVFGTLVKNGDGTWSRTSPHALVESYDANGNLTRVQDRNGNFVSFTYDHAGRLPVTGASDYFVTQSSGVILRDYRVTQISDAVGRTVDFNYDGNGRLSSMSWSGRTITYVYGASGDLATVTLPATPDVPAGSTTIYGYTAHNLTSITDPKGQTYLTNQYDEFDCVYQQTYGGFPSSFTYKNSLQCPETRSSGTTGFQVTVKPLMIQPGQPVRVSWVAPTGNGGDSIQFFPAGGGTSVWTAISTSSSAIGGASFTVPAGAAAGLYEARFVRSGATQRIGNGFRVAAAFPAAETEVTDRRGFVSKFQFDAAGHITRFTQMTDGNPVGEPASYVMTTSYNGLGLPTRIQYPRGNATEFRYDTLGNMTQARRKVIGAAPGTDLPSDLVTTLTYETQYNFIKTITDPRGYTTTMFYDYELSEPSKGNLRRIEAPPGGPLAPTFQFAYLANGEVSTVTDPNGGVTKLLYDSVTGRPNSMTQGFGTPDASTVSFTYDPLGNITSVTDPLGNVTTLQYNARNQLTFFKPPGPYGWLNYLRYDANGNIAQVDRQSLNYAGPLPAVGTTYPYDSWQSTALTYDVLDRVVTAKDDLGHVTTMAYDPAGFVSSIIDANGHTTSWERDERDLVTKITDPSLHETRVRYDANGNPLELLDQRSSSTGFTYDDFDRVATSGYANGTGETFTYDRASNLTNYVDALGRPFQYVYDGMNRLMRKVYPDSSDVVYTYDRAGNMTSATNSVSTISIPSYDALGRVRQVDTTFEGRSWTVSYAYDAAGNRTRMTEPSAAQVTYTYDTMNRPSSILRAGVPVANFYYDTLSRRTERRLYSAYAERTEYVYDAVGRVTDVFNYTDDSMPTGGPGSGVGPGSLVGQEEDSEPADGPASVIIDDGGGGGGGGGSQPLLYSRYLYAYDNTVNRTSQTRILTGVPSAYGYQYDALDELTAVTGTAPHTYGYDAAQNRTVADGVTAVPNNLNQYTSVGAVTHTYDTNGNLTSDGTKTYTYDFDNRLASVTGPGLAATYVYDALGRRIKKTGGTSTVYRYDGWDVIEETSTTGAVRAQYVNGPWVDETLTMSRAGVSYRLFSDGTGTVSDITTPDGRLAEHYDYDPYGRPLSASAASNPYRFAGREYEPDTGLYYMRARHYAPTLGRFLQRDPVGYAMGMNLYAYVGNSPINWIDPFGLWQWSWSGAAAGVGNVIVWGVVGAGVAALAIGLGAPIAVVSAVGLGLGAAGAIGSGIPAITGRGWDGKKLSDYARSQAAVEGALGAAAAAAGAARLPSAFPRGTPELPAGTPVFRVSGGGSRPFGNYWTTVDPRTVPNYRSASGLPNANTGEVLIEGRIWDARGITPGEASPLDGNPGGLPQLRIPHPTSQISNIQVCRPNPRF